MQKNQECELEFNEIYFVAMKNLGAQMIIFK